MYGDWAIYSLEKTDLPYVDLSTVESRRYIDGNTITNWLEDWGYYDQDVRLIGYGVLKIMSDTEIKEFKRKYIAYLRTHRDIKAKGTETEYGFENGGIYAFQGKGGNEYVIEFLMNLKYGEEKDYYYTTFKQENVLKESKCEYTAKGVAKNCQGWGGNSGGGIFDKSGNLMAIHTRGNYIVGGPNHASREDSSPDITHIDLLSNPIKPELKK